MRSRARGANRLLRHVALRRLLPNAVAATEHSSVRIAESRHGPLFESATPHEVTLVHATLAERFVRQLPVRLIGDNADESDGWMQTWHAVACN
jgi:hypothetical protein